MTVMSCGVLWFAKHNWDLSAHVQELEAKLRRQAAQLNSCIQSTRSQGKHTNKSTEHSRQAAMIRINPVHTPSFCPPHVSDNGKWRARRAEMLAKKQHHYAGQVMALVLVDTHSFVNCFFAGAMVQRADQTDIFLR